MTCSRLLINFSFRHMCVALLLFNTLAFAGDSQLGRVEHHQIDSKALAQNLINLNPARAVQVYLPPGFHKAKRHYPVIYHIGFGVAPGDQEVLQLLGHAFREQKIREFIFVTADFSIPGSVNFFGNGPTTGRWLDFVTQELVPFVDSRYPTIATANSRGISGHFLGGYAALRLAIAYPQVFGSVYGLHPVGTDLGDKNMLTLANWAEIHAAQQLSDLKSPYSLPFVAMAQAHLPNPARPPFYADFIVELVDSQPAAKPAQVRKLLDNFHLANLLPKYADNLGQLRAIKFDWGRDDPNPDHVYGARKFSTLLKDYGMPHEAEEYNGDGWTGNGFTTGGRLYDELLPFFNRWLQFQ